MKDDKPNQPQRCDWCHLLATRITQHERQNAGPLTAYWCEYHYEQAQRKE